jgi:hypothetical protein
MFGSKPGKGVRSNLPERPATNLRSVPGFAQIGPDPFFPGITQGHLGSSCRVTASCPQGGECGRRSEGSPGPPARTVPRCRPQIVGAEVHGWGILVGALRRPDSLLYLGLKGSEGGFVAVDRQLQNV